MISNIPCTRTTHHFLNKTWNMMLVLIAFRKQFEVLLRAMARARLLHQARGCYFTNSISLMRRYLTCTIPGGFQVPSPAGRIEGFSVFGQ